MSDTVADRIRNYALDGSDDDLRRLLGVAQVSADMARSAFRRIGVEQGWKAIECGCGPIGGLPVLAEIVGRTGKVVGVDFSEPAVRQARSIAGALRLDNVEVVCGDIHDLDPAALGGPFDLAYTRLFLMHQRDPRKTLSRIAGLVRPGGWIVAQEALAYPPPQSQPQHPSLAPYWGLLHGLLEQLGGVPHDAVKMLPLYARTTGLEVVAVTGSFATMAPDVGFDLHADTLIAARQRGVSSGVWTGEQVDAIVNDLRAARTSGYDWVSTPFYLDLALRKPIIRGTAEPSAPWLRE
jgi:SAM-dependent methyltransferase